MQHDSRDLFPIRTFRLCVEKTPIGDVVLFVIDGYGVVGRRFVVHIGVEFDRNPHSYSLHPERALLAVRPRKWPL